MQNYISPRRGVNDLHVHIAARHTLHYSLLTYEAPSRSTHSYLFINLSIYLFRDTIRDTRRF